MPRLSLARAASPLVVGRLVSAALTFALPLVLARQLDAAAFGAYKQLFLVAQSVLLVSQLGLTQSLYYFLPSGKPDRGAYVGQALALLLPLALIAGSALVVGGGTIASHLGGGALGPLIVPLALLAGALLLAAPLEAALTSEGRLGLAAVAYVLSDGLRAALLLAGARTHGLAGVAWAGALWAALRVLALGCAIAAGIVPIALPRRRMLREQLAYALPFAGSVLLFVGQKQFVQYAIAARFDAATFAIFAVASFHLPVVDIIYTPIGDVLMVELGRTLGLGNAHRLAAWDDAVDKLANVLWPATVCALLFGGVIVPLLFSSRYAASVPLFVVASLEIPLWALPVDPLLRAAGETRFLFTWYGLRLGFTVAAVVGGLHFGGPVGALGGAIASELLSRVVMLRRGTRLLGVPVRRAIDPSLWYVAAGSVLAALPVLALRLVADAKLALAAGIPLYGGTYLALRWRLRARPRRSEVLLTAAS